VWLAVYSVLVVKTLRSVDARVLLCALFVTVTVIGRSGKVEGVANITADLLSIPASREVPNADCRPAEFAHEPCKVPITTCSALTLWYLQDVHQRLRADALQAVEPCRSAHALQAQAPRVYGLHGFGLSGFHSL
jgi:hypothetical protein